VQGRFPAISSDCIKSLLGCFLTGTLCAVYVGARLVAQQQAGLLCARIDAGDWRAALAVATVVREGQRALEGTLHRSGLHSEH
jgi:hypothetical protein